MKAFEQRRVVGHLIRLCQQRAVDFFVEEVGVDGPNPRQFSVLINVFQNPGMSQTALVEASGIDRSTLTEVLKRMIDRGMVSKRRAEADQRTNALFLTEAGLATLESAFEDAERTQDKILEPLRPEDRDQAISILTALAGDGKNAKDAF
jgi:DNA-binding MarR family transcriptional regulator